LRGVEGSEGKRVFIAASQIIPFLRFRRFLHLRAGLLCLSSDVYDVARVPANRISITGKKYNFECNVENIIPVGLIFKTIISERVFLHLALF
jgi:hypothetical protein